MNAIVMQAMERNEAQEAQAKAQEAAARLARRVDMIEAWTETFKAMVATVSLLVGSAAKIHEWAESDSYILVANGTDWRLTVDESYPIHTAPFGAAEHSPARLTLNGLLGDIAVYNLPSGVYFLPLKATIEGRRIAWEARAIYDVEGKDGRAFAPIGLSEDLVDVAAAVLREAPNVRKMADELMAEIYAAESVKTFRILGGAA